MDRASFFIKNRALFGSFPTQESVNELEQAGVKYFINLTFDTEKKIIPYTTKYTYISYPIYDHKIPENHRSFAKFIINISNIIMQLKNNNYVYIHCKGGHGRSGVVVAVLLCHIFGLSPEQSLEYTTKYHSKREQMRDKWRKIGSPQGFQQKSFVYNFCKNIHFYRAYKVGYTAGFSNFSPHNVTIDGIGIFPTSEAALQAFKCIENETYVQKQLNSGSPSFSRNIGNKIDVDDYWYNSLDKLTFKILKLKFDQHPELKNNLLNTGLCHIIHHTKNDDIWGISNNKGKNILGKQLVKLRNHYIQEK